VLCFVTPASVVPVQLFPGNSGAPITLGNPFLATTIRIVPMLGSEPEYSVTFQIYACFEEAPTTVTSTTTEIPPSSTTAGATTIPSISYCSNSMDLFQVTIHIWHETL